jgi:hypothetical protein
VQAELQVVALSRHGLPVSKMRTTIQASDASPLSVVRVELPFVQSIMVLSGYTAEVAATTALDVAPADAADSGAHIARRP